MTKEIEISKLQHSKILRDNPELIKESFNLPKGNLTLHKKSWHTGTDYVLKQVFIYDEKKSKYWMKKL